ncbi:hypothetical protein CAPTEDRAFT_18748 [Capitella teleta]|uniref:N-terminal methionine N(alpha)-acetyltransferase NatC n=1 Tax=Capitella teleta TaxID=283909 RepID=R7U8L3_CAPTE|nr:hypothetical protein CAPTEDRAFT_18748 [Capitella teleta]|eukprot:ELT99450.1 hypothetical protein CAPTEDRAFT_18748 [Capitella teleta]
MPNVVETNPSSTSDTVADSNNFTKGEIGASVGSEGAENQSPIPSVSSQSLDSASAMVETSSRASSENDNCENGPTEPATEVVNGNNSSESCEEDKLTDKEQMPDIMRLITKDLSEPYSIYTYRYFIHNWPKLCFLAKSKGECIGAIVCKLDLHKKMVRRGYIAMLAIDQNYRRKGIGSQLVLMAIKAMIADECDEVVLETEISNKSALNLYQNLGFVRDKRLFRYYLNGVDALRLKLWLR